MAREIGIAIQKDERYMQHQIACANNDADETLQEKIGEFNLKRLALEEEAKKPEQDQAKMAGINDELKRIYDEVMRNPNMAEYNKAKENMDQLLSHINTILIGAANGEDPYKIQVSSCGSGCASCSGCH